MALIAVSAFGAACTVHQTEPPPLSGPSTFAQAVNVTVIPDRITLDGSSQSAVTIQVNGPDGKPVSGIALRLDMVVGGNLQDCGTLSRRSVVTGNDGLAHAVYTAPVSYCVPPPPNQLQTVEIHAVPIGTNAETALSSFASIREVPPGVILPIADIPTPQFTFGPQPVNFNVPVTFDGSSSCPGPAQAGVCVPSAGSSSITSYSWNFGDGGTASGRVVTHTYTGPQTSFQVTLTVTNDRGIPAPLTKVVSVSASPAPSGDWVNSPVNPVVGDNVIFNADKVQAAQGHTIVQYSWNFGDGATGSGFITTHTFTLPNTYAVVLSVLDDAQQKTVISHNLTVGTGQPVASFIASSSPPPLHTMSFDASASHASGSAVIVTYSWNFGDGTFLTTSAPVVTHTYGATGPETVTLTVTDNATPPRTGTSAPQVVTVP